MRDAAGAFLTDLVAIFRERVSRTVRELGLALENMVGVVKVGKP